MQSILARQTRGIDAPSLPRLGTELESAYRVAPDLQISSRCHLRVGQRRICQSSMGLAYDAWIQRRQSTYLQLSIGDGTTAHASVSSPLQTLV